MKRRSTTQAILFADIGGSSALYKDLGNHSAKQVIDQVLQASTHIVIENQGLVVKTIGDEIMCGFVEASHAVSAAMRMQKQLAHFLKRYPICLNIGIGYGEIISEQGDFFGEAVNTAAHLTSLASGGQILITLSCRQQIQSEQLNYVREFDHIRLKGADDASLIYRVYWQDDSAHSGETRLMTRESAFGTNGVLEIECEGCSRLINAAETPFVFGRDEAQCDFLVEGAQVSRRHCEIHFSRGKFVLVDRSTNGCYLTVEGNQVYIRREEYPLLQPVSLSLGIPADQAQQKTIQLFMRYE